MTQLRSSRIQVCRSSALSPAIAFSFEILTDCVIQVCLQSIEFWTARNLDGARLVFGFSGFSRAHPACIGFCGGFPAPCGLGRGRLPSAPSVRRVAASCRAVRFDAPANMDKHTGVRDWAILFLHDPNAGCSVFGSESGRTGRSPNQKGSNYVRTYTDDRERSGRACAQ